MTRMDSLCQFPEDEERKIRQENFLHDKIRPETSDFIRHLFTRTLLRHLGPIMERQQLVEKVQEWSRKEHGKVVKDNDLLELFNGEHGHLFMKMFKSCSERFVSKETKKSMKALIESVGEKTQMDEMNEAVEDLLKDQSTKYQHDQSPVADSSTKTFDPINYLNLIEEISKGMMTSLSRLEQVSGGNVQDLKQSIEELILPPDNPVIADHREVSLISAKSNISLAADINDQLDMVADFMEELKDRVDSESDCDASGHGLGSTTIPTLVSHACKPFGASYEKLEDSTTTNQSSVTRDNQFSKKAFLIAMRDKFEDARKVPLVKFGRDLIRRSNLNN